MTDEFVRPDYGGCSFDALPGTVELLLTGAASSASLDARVFPPAASRWERVVLVYLDAFGWELFERVADHPVFRRAELALRLTSQFPSTTAAEVTTIHSGLPVGEHGVYEWYVYEPLLDRLIAPLFFSYAGDDARETLHGSGLAPASVFPTPTLYRRLAEEGVESHVFQPAGLLRSSAGTVLLAGANVHGFTDVGSGAAELATLLTRVGGGYGHLYVGVLDELMHRAGPASPAVPALVDALLATVEELVAQLPADTLVLLVSDHGMAPVSPERTMYVNVVWPGLANALRRGADGKPLAPAGSPRDLFLHAGERREEVVDGLGAYLEGRARVFLTDELIDDGFFGPTVGERLRRRVGDVVVLPRENEAVYWYERGRFEQRWHGMHGGLSAAEMLVPLVAFVA